MGKHTLLALIAASVIVALTCIAHRASAEDEYVRTRSGNIEVVHDQRIADGATETLRLYRQSMIEIGSKLGGIGDGPEPPATIVLVKSKDGFLRLSGSDLISAYAVGERGLIVLDYHRVLTKPFTLAGTIKHEAAHLWIYNHVRGHVPRWLNEGIAQWVSGAEAEIELSPMGRALDKAVLTGAMIPLGRLENAFPSDGPGMQLAYEQSASIVNHIANKHGDGAIGKLLDGLRDGYDMDGAMRMATGRGYYEVERSWAASVKARVTWVNYLLGNFMEVLLIVAALLSIIGYIIVHMRIRNYKDDDDISAIVDVEDAEAEQESDWKP